MTMQQVVDEIKRSRTIHGPLSRDHGRVAKILMREVLEAAQEEAQLSHQPRLSAQRTLSLMALRSELIQVIAVAAQWINNLDEEVERNEKEANANNNRAGSAVGQ